MDTPVPPSAPADDGPRTTSTPTILYRRPNAQTSSTPTTPADPSISEETPAEPATPAIPTLPAISDYWPDAPHRLGSRTEGAARISHHPRSRIGEPGAARPAPPSGAAKRRRPRRPLLLALAALLLAGTGVAGARLVPHLSARSSTVADASATTQPPTARPPAAPSATVAVPSAKPSAPTTSNTISAPANARSAATFELVSNATSVNLRAAALGADLYRITTAKNSAVPQVKSTDSGIRLSLVNPSKRVDTTVDIVLNSRIRWSLTMTGGVRNSVLNLAGTTVGSVTLNGGATRIDLTLPRPSGTMPVRMSGGANQFQIRTTGAVPARLRIRKGAGRVVFNGQTDNGVARGAAFASPDFAGSGDRIDVDAIAGVGTLTVGPV
ncbi:MAG TPA: hypothetical protein VGP57_02325 [Actinoplanes sp.]|nr:hypothetical protein [Actinoplanes sp.]